MTTIMNKEQVNQKQEIVNIEKILKNMERGGVRSLTPMAIGTLVDALKKERDMWQSYKNYPGNLGFKTAEEKNESCDREISKISSLISAIIQDAENNE